MCKEIASTKKEDLFMQHKLGNSTLADSQITGEDSTISFIPAFHDEYQKTYPLEGKGYEALRNEYAQQRIIMKNKALNMDRCVLHTFGNVRQILRTRWQCYGLDLMDTIPRLKIGQVWKGHPMLVNPPRTYANNSFNEGYQKYQTMRNTSSPKINFRKGKSYISIGFVDLQQVMEAEIMESEVDAPVVWRGYEMSEIAVARAMIILELINHDTPVQEILQIWYSSCISSEASISLQRCCKTMKERETDPKLKKLFHCWSNATVDAKEAEVRWCQYLSTSQMRAITSPPRTLSFSTKPNQPGKRHLVLPAS